MLKRNKSSSFRSLLQLEWGYCWLFWLAKSLEC
jgi:hypothetical protein